MWSHFLNLIWQRTKESDLDGKSMQPENAALSKSVQSSSQQQLISHLFFTRSQTHVPISKIKRKQRNGINDKLKIGNKRVST